MSDQPFVRYLGGEAGYRNFFGGTGNGLRNGLLALCVAGGLFGMVFGGGLWALAAGCIGAVLVVVATIRTHRGSILDRWKRRNRWKARKRAGTDRFEPYEVARWDQLTEATQHGTRVERRAAQKALAGMRANPDGADGMGWLQYGSRVPGIAWHAPSGEQPYLSVAFAVSGQLRGLEGADKIVRAAEGWGKFLAGRAGSESLVRRVQTLSRLLPPDTARQQHWAAQNIDDAPDDPEQRAKFMQQLASYDEVIRLSSANAMVQRHYVILSWPLSGEFLDTASSYGEGRDGWRRLMADQIEATVRGLKAARQGEATPLTARQTAALILHQQNPHLLIDAARRAEPLNFGVRSHDEFSAHIVEGVDELHETEDGNPVPVTWWHRTAAIRADALETGGRTPLWTLKLVTGAELDFIRSISFHINLVPATEAKVRARKDVTSDASALLADQKKGRQVSDQTEGNLTAAQRRRKDLSAGSSHQGVEWIGYITISARSRDELARASRRLSETCKNDPGIARLDWLDSFQAAASGLTWPIGRGITPTGSTAGGRMIQALAGHTEKEALS